MQSDKGLCFQGVASIVLLLACSAVIMAQTQDAAVSSAKSSHNRSLKQRLEQLRQAAVETHAVATEPQPSPSTFDPRDQAHQIVPQNPARLPGAPTAPERYVFGRMDLAIGNY